MDLDIFKHIDEVIEVYEGKRDIYKLIIEEIVDHFEQHIFPESKFTLNITSRIKSASSIREKLVRNSYLGKYDTPEDVLEHISDVIGLRIECKFIDDEQYVYELLRTLFAHTEDGVYYFDSALPKLRLKLVDAQPQKQKNGFDIYKVDGQYLLGRDAIRFELQIKALVNIFWGEIEHKIIYKNKNYRVNDSYLQGLMLSIKKNLNMIDAQLYELYERFKRAEDDPKRNNTEDAISRFVSKMVHDAFSTLVDEQTGMAFDFRDSCDAVVNYIMDVNGACNLEDYGRVMLQVIYTLNSIRGGEVRVDQQIEFDRKPLFQDVFSQNIYRAIERMINIDYNWHLFFLMLFSLDRGTISANVESYIRYYRNLLLCCDELLPLSQLDEESAAQIKFDLIDEVSAAFRARPNIRNLCPAGIASICGAMGSVVGEIVADICDGIQWQAVRSMRLMELNQHI